MANLGTVMVADDEALARHSLAEALQEEGYLVYEAADGNAAVQLLEEREIDVVLSDLKMPGLDGLAILQKVRELYPQTMVLLMTAYASVETVIDALRLGAQDYLLKPLLLDDVMNKVRRLLEHKQQAWEVQLLRRELARRLSPDGLIGNSPAMQGVLTLISKVAPTNATVLIAGESGVGKEVVARALHAQSAQKDRVFLPINCSAIPETLLESQLFGYVKGAFTGAMGNQEGLFQRARGGTMFLDEIGELPLTLQPKLLRAIEEKEVLPVGATVPVKTDIRLLAATNRDLKREVEEGRFREDLYYRLNVIQLTIPPLRERREDLPLLVDYLVHRQNRELNKSYKGVENAAMKMVLALPWKGNIRELDNVLERGMILGNGEWITLADLPRTEAQDTMDVRLLGDNLKEAVQAYEKNHVETVLKKFAGEKKSAAEALGVSLSSLYRKLEELGVQTDKKGHL
ncbi:MAG: sigma-54-dependent Fis family transcriptional regulator [Deltaproteobacteria bacterium]|nr:sigma-54-dependent Fis family transcriptional regulator [Deltaproteobacteria bacterium]